MDVDKARSDLFHLLDATEDDLYKKSTKELLQLCEVWCAFREAVITKVNKMDPKQIGELHNAGIHVQLEHFAGACLDEALVEDAMKLITEDQEADKKLALLEEKAEADLPEQYKEAMRLCNGTKYFPPFQGESMGGHILAAGDVGFLKDLSPDYYKKWEDEKEGFTEDGGEDAIQISKVAGSCVVVLWPHSEEHEDEEEGEHEGEPSAGEQSGQSDELYEPDPNWQLMLLDLNNQETLPRSLACCQRRAGHDRQ
eukprot:TRINITY_DN16252_c1_g3_i1.p2 TRINITY_DN16252_c1_g3~~TRINITY_DN16252_c1_g3_i1.p2  ORF type:complete len:263 (-),score=43.18 TRINITY_DN16252_c1_g3_i1:6-767(-)